MIFSTLHPIFSTYDFFNATSRACYGKVLDNARQKHGLESTGPEPVYRWLYAALREGERPHWQQYIEDRVEKDGWDGALLIRRMRALPRSTSQAHRWFLFKMHLKGPITTGRNSKAGVCVSGKCALCGRGGDDVRHIVMCDEADTAYQRIRRQAKLPPSHAGLGTLLLQNDMDGATRAGIIAFWHAIWKVRGARLRGNGVCADGDVADTVATMIESPWIAASLQTLTRKERRASRIREPSPVGSDVAVYRADGASRKELVAKNAGYGAAFWPTGSCGLGAPTGAFREHIGDASNNVAEYSGVEVCFRRAVNQNDRKVLFEVDSLLLAKQLSSQWGCRRETLQAFYVTCCGHADELSKQGKSWRIRHIYREFNQAADTLANEAIDDLEGNGASGKW